MNINCATANGSNSVEQENTILNMGKTFQRMCAVSIKTKIVKITLFWQVHNSDQNAGDQSMCNYGNKKQIVF